MRAEQGLRLVSQTKTQGKGIQVGGAARAGSPDLQGLECQFEGCTDRGTGAAPRVSIQREARGRWMA